MRENYLGNPNLKAANVKIEFTEEQIQEYLKCTQDPMYFIQNYVKIVNLDEGLIPFKPYGYQEKMINSFHDNRFVLCKMARQSGKSTTIIAYLLWYVIFNEQQNVAILANKGALARELLGKAQLAYEHLPNWLQQGVVVWNKGNIELENGSKMVASSTSSSAVRGSSYNIIFLDEFAFVPNNIADEFFSSVYPTISSGKTTKVFIVSTPNGLNMFYKMWVDAEEGRSTYKPIEVHWSDVPGRDEAWKEETIKNTSAEQFAQEFDCEFIGSANTLINASKLKSLVFRPPVHKSKGFDVYQHPKQGREYVMVVDTARGIGNDYSAFSVIDITSLPYIQVAKYRSRTISPMTFPSVIKDVAKHYNQSHVLVEINDVGASVADSLHTDYEYENLLMVTFKGRSGQMVGGGFGKKVQTGVRTTMPIKKVGCANIKELIERDKLIVNDFDTISEMTTFVSKKASYEAEEGKNDDLMMTLVLFGWLIDQPYFKEFTETDVRRQIQEEEEETLQENLLPFGFIDDGKDEEESFQDDEGNVWRSVPIR